MGFALVALSVTVLLKDARRSVTSWCRRHTIGGDGAVAAARHRQRTDEPGPLSREQELELVEALRGHYPEELGLDGGLWTRQSVAALAQRRYGQSIEPADVGGYLRAWGLGPREPTDRACGLCVDAVQRWLRTDYPAIVKSARDQQAELWWIGRTRLYGVVPAADILSAVSVRDGVQFAVTGPSVSTRLPREFLLRLGGDPDRRVHAVVDGSWPHAEWPRRLPGWISLHPLPSCGRRLAGGKPAA